MGTSRRGFLQAGLAAAGGAGLGYAAFSLWRKPGQPPGIHEALGPLYPVRDENTGLELLRLPAGFRYRTMGWAGETMSDGFKTPIRCDGMGAIQTSDSGLVLVRNHELRGSSGAMGPQDKAWDVTGGGTTSLRFNPTTEVMDELFISLNGTLNNCAGGVTPWGTWLSCEEGPYTPELVHLGNESRQQFWSIDAAGQSHGYVFEVHPDQHLPATPLLDMGQFYHEAAAVDADTGMVYLTEDRSPRAGMYRFIPHSKGRLADGGRLQMLRVEGEPDLRAGLSLFSARSFDWVDIDDPQQGHSPGTHDCQGVVNQGLEAGGTAFIGLEGCDVRNGQLYFTSKSGGQANTGQVFRLNLLRNELELIFESGARGGFAGPDNLVLSPRGGIVICEDRQGADDRGQFIIGLSEQGEAFAFAQINPQLQGLHAGHDLAATARVSEWAGACFSPDGQWMFANIFMPGISCAITGPWEQGVI